MTERELALTHEVALKALLERGAAELAPFVSHFGLKRVDELSLEDVEDGGAAWVIEFAIPALEQVAEVDNVALSVWCEVTRNGGFGRRRGVAVSVISFGQLLEQRFSPADGADAELEVALARFRDDPPSWSQRHLREMLIGTMADYGETGVSYAEGYTRGPRRYVE